MPGWEKALYAVPFVLPWAILSVMGLACRFPLTAVFLGFTVAAVAIASGFAYVVKVF